MIDADVLSVEGNAVFGPYRSVALHNNISLHLYPLLSVRKFSMPKIPPRSAVVDSRSPQQSDEAFQLASIPRIPI